MMHDASRGVENKGVFGENWVPTRAKIGSFQNHNGTEEIFADCWRRQSDISNCDTNIEQPRVSLPNIVCDASVMCSALSSSRQAPVDDLIAIYDQAIAESLPGRLIAHNTIGSSDVVFKSLFVTSACDAETGDDLTPLQARERQVSYSGAVYVDAVARGVDVRLMIARMPICVGSHRCHLRNRTFDELERLGEPQRPAFGYYIIGGTRYVFLMQDRLRINKAFVFDKQDRLCCEITPLTVRGTSVISVFKNATSGLSLTLRLTDKKSWQVFGVFDAVMHGVDCKIPAEERISRVVKRFDCALALFCPFGTEDLEAARRWDVMVRGSETIRQSRADFKRHVRAGQFEIDSIHEALHALRRQRSAARSGSSATPTKLAILNSNSDQFEHIAGTCACDKCATLIEMLMDLFPTTPDASDKLCTLAMMVARYVEVEVGYTQRDELNAWSNKRLTSGGPAIAQRFGQELDVHIASLRAEVDRIAQEAVISGVSSAQCDTLADFALKMTSSFEKMFTANDSGASSRGQAHAEPMRCDTLVAELDHLTKASTPANRESKNPKLREVQPFLVICPPTTQESKTVGLVKVRSCLTVVSREESPVVLMGWLNIIKALVSPVDILLKKQERANADAVCVNGRLVGFVLRSSGGGVALRNKVVEWRRGRAVSWQTTASMNLSTSTLHIYTDGQRPMRPLFVAGKHGKLLAEERGVANLTMLKMLILGVIEYLDPMEEESDAFVCESVSHLREDNGKTPFTHCEIHPLAMLGVSASLGWLFEHEQAPRNTYQQGMTKQAMAPVSNVRYRTERTLKTLEAPTGGVCRGLSESAYGVGNLATGQAVTLMIAPFDGFNVEDGIIVNSASVDRGLLRRVIYRQIVADFDVTHEINSRSLTAARYARQGAEFLDAPPVERASAARDERYRHVRKALSAGHRYPIAAPGSQIEVGDCVIAKTHRYRKNGGTGEIVFDASVYAKAEEVGTVVSVMVADGKVEGKTMRHVSVKIAYSTPPQVGDKVSSHFGQKGTISSIVPPENLPQVCSGPDRIARVPLPGGKFYDVCLPGVGVVPDLLMNPHGMPSRMTPGQVDEGLAGIVGSMLGLQFDVSSFGNFNVHNIVSCLKAAGFSPAVPVNSVGGALHPRDATVRCIDGITGKMVSGGLFCGMLDYQALRHLSGEKAQARRRGAMDSTLRAPPRGKIQGGGLRLGEADRDAFIAYGAGSLTVERFMLTSDPFRVFVCVECGSESNVRSISGSEIITCCSVCGSERHAVVPITYVSHLIAGKLAATGQKLKLIAKDPSEISPFDPLSLDCQKKRQRPKKSVISLNQKNNKRRRVSNRTGPHQIDCLNIFEGEQSDRSDGELTEQDSCASSETEREEDNEEDTENEDETGSDEWDNESWVEDLENDTTDKYNYDCED